jgi:hypothetical protein
VIAILPYNRKKQTELIVMFIRHRIKYTVANL